MTVRWSQYAQSLTDRPMKGMLTGPVTVLQWSFVRDDQSRADTCRQIALALRDEVLDAFVRFQYPNEIGPGVYDIHSPRVPDKEEMLALLRKAADVLRPEQIWVNPDCGLKTRGWKETRAALEALLAAARQLREETADANAA
jgi:methionine synthase II (cobalamin-independent)